ncbi:MAG: pentapeptide repeat-containing protein [Tolypothrix carrinoi HA7290-LM1]|nr:pentapeptide repeat-containing protein [Tolypothrix carrinoi HA7290-LM1]
MKNANLSGIIRSAANLSETNLSGANECRGNSQ